MVSGRYARGGASNRLPHAVLERFSLYLREAESLSARGVKTVSSQELGHALGLTPAQVRKDLGLVGPLGARGVGYRLPQLVAALRNALGTDRQWPLALVGVGQLGRALVRHKGFRDQGFRFEAIFDRDPALIGRRLAGLRIEPVDHLEQRVRERRIRVAVLAVPPDRAQEVADELVRAGIKGILNFASTGLVVPDDVEVVSVDLGFFLEQLTHHIVSMRHGEHGRVTEPERERR